MLLRFICTDESFVKGPEQLLAGNIYLIGRSSKCAFVLRERSVSRVHAEVEVQEAKLIVKDLKSRNGIYVDGNKVEQAELKSGQRVYFGSVLFLLSDAANATEDDAQSRASTFVFLGKRPSVVQLVARLSQAERRVLEYLKTGCTKKEVAVKLLLSEHTVHNHAKAIYKKLNVTTRAELLALFMAE